MKKTALLIWVLVLCLMLSACGEPTPTEMQPTSNQIVTNPDVTPAEPTKGTSVPTEPENTPTEPTEPEDTKPEPGNSCDHEFGQWMVVQEATCEEKGSRLRICALCSYAQVEELQAKGHTTQSGTCQRCQQWIGEQPPEVVRDTIEVYDVYVSKIDSAGGVNMGIAFTNTSNKTIKYIHFYVTPYNAVGDRVSCEIRGYSNFDAYVTGPLEPGYEGYSRYGDNCYASISWEACWYNYDVSYIELTGIYIEYMDGSTYRLYSDEVAEAFAEYPVDPKVADLGYLTGFSYDSKKERFDFDLMLLNRHSVCLRQDAYVDIRIQNDNGVVLLDHTYRVDASDFEDGYSMSMGNTAVATIHIPLELLESTNENYGRLYYRVYSTDGSWEFPEEYETTFDLPEKDWANIYAEVTGFSYYQYYTTFTASNGSVLVIEDYDYEAESYYNDASKHNLKLTLVGRKISGDDQYTINVSGKVLNEKGQVVKTFTQSLRSLKTGNSFEFSVTLSGISEGDYWVVFDGMLCDNNGLLYSLTTDSSGYYAVISENCAGDLMIPSSYNGKPVVGLVPYRYPNNKNYVAPMITSVYIPASVSNVEYGIFAYCNTLRSIDVDPANPVYYSKGNCLIERESGTLVAGCVNSAIPADGSVTQLGYRAFAGLSELETIEIPEGITYMGDGTFENCTGLKYITIPASVNTLEWNLFAECTSLESVVVRGSLTYIGFNVFKDCYSLTEFQLQDTVKVVDMGAFTGCINLIEVENGIQYVGQWVVGYEGNPHTAEFRQGTVGVADNAFLYCPTLKEVQIPASCEYIGSYAFEKCPELRRVVFQGENIKFGYLTFFDCGQLKDIYFEGTVAQWQDIEKDDNWFTGETWIHCSDTTQYFCNIKSASSRINWTHVSSSADKWNFYSPYIDKGVLYIDCYSVFFQASISWKDDKNTGWITGEASESEGFYSVVPVTAQYGKKTYTLGEEQRILLQISLEELGDDRPEKLYIRLYAYVNGKLQTINCNFTIEW